MRHRALLAPLLVTLCVVSSCRAPGDDHAQEPGPSVEADVAAITELFAAWTRAYNCGDFDRIVTAFYSENAIQMPPDEAPRRGREAILHAYRQNRELNDERCDSSVIDEVRVSGDLAVARGTDTGTSAPRYGGGKPAPYRVKWLIVLERQPDGSWQWTREIWNDDPLDEAPDPAQQQ